MDASFPIAELINLGTNGLTLVLVWGLLKANEQLRAEITSHNDLLLDIINRLLEIEGKRGMTRREDRRELE